VFFVFVFLSRIIIIIIAAIATIIPITMPAMSPGVSDELGGGGTMMTAEQLL